MYSRSLVLLLVAGMALSFALPWLSPAVAGIAAPSDLFRDVPPEALLGQPPELLVFGASFALAALTTLMGVFGMGLRLPALLTGVFGLCAVGYGIVRLQETGEALGLPPELTNLSLSPSRAPEILGMMSGMLDLGGYLYLVGAAVATVLAIVDPGRPRRDPYA